MVRGKYQLCISSCCLFCVFGFQAWECAVFVRDLRAVVVVLVDDGNFRRWVDLVVGRPETMGFIQYGTPGCIMALYAFRDLPASKSIAAIYLTIGCRLFKLLQYLPHARSGSTGFECDRVQYQCVCVFVASVANELKWYRFGVVVQDVPVAFLAIRRCVPVLAVGEAFSRVAIVRSFMTAMRVALVVIVICLGDVRVDEFLWVGRRPLPFIVDLNGPGDFDRFVHRNVYLGFIFYDGDHRQLTVQRRRPTARLSDLTQCNEYVAKVISRANVCVRGTVFVGPYQGRAGTAFPVRVSER